MRENMNSNRGETMKKQIVFTITILIVFSGVGTAQKRTSATPTVDEAQRFVADAERRLKDLSIRSSRADWINRTYITNDTETLSAEALTEMTSAITDLAKASRRFDGLKLPYDVSRKITLLRLALVLPAPDNPTERDELTRIAVSMRSQFSKGQYCPNGRADKCLSLGDMEQILATSRDPEELKRVWIGWRTVAPAYRNDYRRFVDIANKGAREMGFKDVGAMWRSKYDMEPDAFAAEMERLWLQVKPLYESLYKYVRRQLAKKYGRAVVPENGPIPAHLLGNMWAQDWTNIYPLVKPDNVEARYDLTSSLVNKKVDAKGLVRYGEGFFTSLGFDPLPTTFWERSMFVKPADREVACQASAWTIDAKKDVRLKMCIKINEEDFVTVHHELGHNYYYLAYASLPYLYQESSNDGFHEAIGDAVALSVTPEYLKTVGLIDKVPGAEGDIGFLLHKALEKVSFIPFGYMVDQWRWKVFNGEIKPADYSKAWWDIAATYQGIAPPVTRSEADFDPGAKFHVAANVPYSRYFLAAVLQFQFHRSLCRIAGNTGPLHRCSIYGSKEAGRRLAQMLAMGSSRPWPEALEALTGEDKMDATAVIDYFAPLKKWHDEQNSKLQ
jgi:peptidyl-dipeptidase A